MQNETQGKSEVKCAACNLLWELYQQVPQTNRNYWVATELFSMLHGGDVCPWPKGDAVMECGLKGS